MWLNGINSGYMMGPKSPITQALTTKKASAEFLNLISMSYSAALAGSAIKRHTNAIIFFIRKLLKYYTWFGLSDLQITVHIYNAFFIRPLILRKKVIKYSSTIIFHL